MAILKQRLNRKNDNGSYDTIYLEGLANNIRMSESDNTLLSDKINSIDNIISTKRIPCGKNLLHNWYFINPINDLGQSIYTSSSSASVPSINRWLWWGQYINDAKLVLTQYGLVMQATNSLYQSISQQLDTRIFNNKMSDNIPFTLSCVAFAETPASLILAFGNKYGALPIVANKWTILSQTFTIGDITNYKVYIQKNTSNVDITIGAAKLEVGSEQTLAYTNSTGYTVYNEIPSYAEQLLECSQASIINSGDNTSPFPLYRQQAFYSTDTNPSQNYNINWTYA